MRVAYPHVSMIWQTRLPLREIAPMTTAFAHSAATVVRIALAEMLVLFLSADESFIYFDDAHQLLECLVSFMPARNRMHIYQADR